MYQPTRRILRSLEKLGASLVPVSLPSTSYALSAYYVIASAEASSNMARYDGVQYGIFLLSCPLATINFNFVDEVYIRRLLLVPTSQKHRVSMPTHVRRALEMKSRNGYYSAHTLSQPSKFSLWSLCKLRRHDVRTAPLITISSKLKRSDNSSKMTSIVSLAHLTRCHRHPRFRMTIIP
jgi:hypothetical protein